MEIFPLLKSEGLVEGMLSLRICFPYFLFSRFLALGSFRAGPSPCSLFIGRRRSCRFCFGFDYLLPDLLLGFPFRFVLSSPSFQLHLFILTSAPNLFCSRSIFIRARTPFWFLDPPRFNILLFLCACPGRYLFFLFSLYLFVPPFSVPFFFIVSLTVVSVLPLPFYTPNINSSFSPSIQANTMIPG
jgi:hypothetical protein